MFQTTIMVWFEIHQSFKGHFLNELRVPFKLSHQFEYFSSISTMRICFMFMQPTFSASYTLAQYE